MTDHNIWIKSFPEHMFLEHCLPVVKEFICPVCSHVFLDPVMVSCGCLFCKHCVNYPINQLCPRCDKSFEIGPLTTIDYIVKIINKQLVYCKNQHLGCNWNGLLMNFEDHYYNSCAKLEVSCKFSNCTAVVFKEDLEKHKVECEFRSIFCEYCSLEIPFNSLAKHIDIDCQKITIQCSNDCGESCERMRITQHIEFDCQNALVNCSFRRFGCYTQMLRKELYAHRGDVNHNEIIIKYLNKTETDIRFMMESLSQTGVIHDMKCNKLVNKLENYIEQLEKEYLANTILSNETISTLPQKPLQNDAVVFRANPLNPVLSNPSNNQIIQDLKPPQPLEKAKLKFENLAKNKREREKSEISTRTQDESVSCSEVEKQRQFLIFSDENNRNSKLKTQKKALTIERSIFNRETRVVFLKDNFQISLHEWVFKFEENVFGFGMCIKEIIQKNGFQINYSTGTKCHGCFIICATGVQLNASNPKEDLANVENFIKPAINEDIHIFSDLCSSELQIKIRNREYKLTKVQQGNLVPCKVVFS